MTGLLRRNSTFMTTRFALSTLRRMLTKRSVISAESIIELESSWQVFRSSRPGPRWQPEQVFETLKREFSDLSWGSQINLLNFPNTAPRLESRFAKMRDIKANKGFPHMAVSKFLHFYTPALFPIYDEAMIWNRVFKRFDTDFYSFCWNARIDYQRAKNDDTTAFLRYYMLWANSLMSKAHPRFMDAFKDWLHSKPRTRLEDRLFDPTTLYARAFEYTAIGAANLKRG